MKVRTAIALAVSGLVLGCSPLSPKPKPIILEEGDNKTIFIGDVVNMRFTSSGAGYDWLPDYAFTKIEPAAPTTPKEPKIEETGPPKCGISETYWIAYKAIKPGEQILCFRFMRPGDLESKDDFIWKATLQIKK